MSADKCPHCGADEISYGWYRCGACFTDKEPTPLCKERVARQKAEAKLEEARRELEAMKQDYSDLIDAAVNNCKGCHGAGQDNDGEGYISEPCPDCAWIARVAPRRSQEIQEGDAKPTELEETRRKLEEWKSTTKALWRGVMAEDDDQILQAAMVKASKLIESEKDGGV